MNTKSLSHAFSSIVAATFFVTGCVAETASPSDIDEPVTHAAFAQMTFADGEVEAPSEQNETIVPALPGSVAAELGVINWRISDSADPNAYIVEGLDNAGVTITHTILSVQIDGDGNPVSASVEHMLPWTESTRMVLDGTKLDGGLSKEGAAFLQAIADDFKAVEADGELMARRKGCVWLTIAMVAACGSGMAACIISGGNPAVCFIGGSVCLSVINQYLLCCR